MAQPQKSATSQPITGLAGAGPQPVAASKVPSDPGSVKAATTENRFWQAAYTWRYLWIPISGFILLAPGLILTLPAGSNGVFFSGQSSFLAVLVAALLFAVYIFLVNFAVAHMAKEKSFTGAARDWRNTFVCKEDQIKGIH